MVVFGNLKHEYLNRLWSSLAVNVLIINELLILKHQTMDKVQVANNLKK
jgi:hypothetical protein